MRIAPIFILLASVFSIFGQNANIAIDGVPNAERSTLRARVYYEDTGRPVRRTSVMLISKGRGNREQSGITDWQGNLEIKNLPAGKYFAIVNAPGVVSPFAYVDVRKEREGAFDQQMTGVTPIVVNGVSDTEVQIPVRRGGAISGRVTHSDGEVAIGVKVEILRKVDDDFLITIPNFSILSSMASGGAGTLLTDDRGYFRFAGLPAGEYIVKASENVRHGTTSRDEDLDSLIFGTGSMVTVFFENALDKGNAKLITVEFGQEQPEISIVLPDHELHTLSGRVVAAKGKLSIRNAKIYLKREGDDVGGNAMESDRVRQNSQTDGKGIWKFNELPRGKYKLFVEAQDSEFDEAQQTYGREYSNMPANTMPASNIGLRPAATPARKFARRVQEVTIADKDIADLVIEMSFGATVSGSVKTHEGKDMPISVTVRATNEEGDISSLAHVYNYDYEGTSTSRKLNHDFQIEGVTSGKTYLTIEVAEPDYYVKSATLGGVDLLKDAFELKEGEDLKNVQIILAKDVGTLAARVVDGDKQPVAGARLSLVPTDPVKFRNSSFYRTVVSNEIGEFEAKLAPMEYAIVSIPAGAPEKGRDHFYKWLAGAVKSAQTFKIEAGRAQKVTIRRESAKTGQ